METHPVQFEAHGAPETVPYEATAPQDDAPPSSVLVQLDASTSETALVEAQADLAAIVGSSGEREAEPDEPPVLNDSPGLSSFDDPAQAAAEAEIQQTKLGAIDGTFTADDAALAELLRDPDPTVSAAAFEALADQDATTAMSALLSVVDDPGETVRFQALELLLGAAGDDSAGTAILQSSLTDPDPSFVARAVEGLVARSDPESLQILSDSLAHGELGTRLQIVEAIGSSSPARPLLERGLADPEPAVRTATADMLRRIQAAETPMP